MATRREAIKAFALGSALLNSQVLMQLAQAETAATPAATPSAALGATGLGVVIREMLVQPLPEPGNRVATMVVVEYAPGAASPPHRHPGPVFGYVLEGSVQIGIDNHPPLTYSEGDMWYEEPRHEHRVSGNASTTAPAKILAFVIVAKGQPILEAIKVPS